MKEKIQQITKEFKEKISLIYKNRLSSLILFGSQARGDAEEFSDIDILVVLKGNINLSEELEKISKIRQDICLKFDEVISCIFTTEEKFLNEKSSFYKNVKREGVII